MSWSLDTIREGLATRLRTIPDLHVYPKYTGQITVPTAMVLLGDGQFLTYDSSSDSDDLTLTVRLFTSAANDPAGQDLLDDYLNRNTDRSIYDAVAGDPTLGGVVDDASVTGVSGYGQVPVGLIEYFGCEFIVEVLVS